MSWRPIFIHEFLDTRLDNVLGLPGTVVSSLPPPIVRRNATILPGIWFGYQLDEPRPNVIGMDVNYRVHAPTAAGGARLPLISIPDAMDIVLRFDDPITTEVIDGNLVAHAQLQVRLGPQDVVWDNLRVPHRSPISLRVTWHTSGQLQLAVNRELTAYHPLVVPSAQFGVSRIVFGDPSLPSANQPRFFMHYVSVKILQEDDAVQQILPEFPDADPGNLVEDPVARRCAVLIRVYQREIIRKYREFMRLFIPATTSPWLRTDQSQTPTFEASAVTAHNHALAAFTALMRFLREHDAAARTDYLTHIEGFLTELRNELPDEFKELLQDVNSIPKLPQECFDLAKDFLEENADVFQPVQQLSVETLNIAQRLADERS